jgi:hypothetical protein
MSKVHAQYINLMDLSVTVHVSCQHLVTKAKMNHINVISFFLILNCRS